MSEERSTNPPSIRRVFIVTWWLGDFGGAEQMIADEAIALSDEGVDVTIFSEMPVHASNQYAARLVRAGVRIDAPSGPLGRMLARVLPRVRRRATSGIGQERPRRFQRAVRVLTRGPRRAASAASHRRLSRAIDAAWGGEGGTALSVQGFAVDTAWLAAWAQDAGLPVVYTEHGSIGELGGPRSERAAEWLAAADLVICGPGRAQEALEALIPNQRGKFRPLRQIIHDQFAGPTTKDQVAPPDGGILNLGCVARLARDKGIDVLIRAFASLAQEHEHLRLLLFGDGDDRGEFESLARQLGVERRVEFRGAFEHSKLNRVMSEIDIFVLPSLTEVAPLAILEAMAFAKPIVGTDVGSVSSLIRHGENGLLAAPGDVDGLRRAIATMVDDPASRRRFGASGKRSFEAGDHRPGAVARLLIAYYDEAARHSAAARGVPSAR